MSPAFVGFGLVLIGLLVAVSIITLAVIAVLKYRKK